MNYAVPQRSYISASARLALVALVIFVVAGSAGTAYAEIVLQSSAGTPLPQGDLVQYTITAVGTEGERIQTFMKPEITPAGFGLGVHNVAQFATNAGTPTKEEHTPSLFNPSWAPYDTYFLFDDPGLTLEFRPFAIETNDGATTGTLQLSVSPGQPRSGFGQYGLNPRSRITLLSEQAASQLPFMQVVMRRGDFALFDIEIVAEGGTPRTVISDYLIGVPEPATNFLVMPAAALILGRRQTRQRGTLISPSAARF
jgi:hypothetical protein